MSFSYNSLPGVFASILLLVFYRKRLNLIVKAGIVFNIYMLFIIFINGTRGAAVAIVVFLLFFVVKKQSSSGQKTRFFVLFASIAFFSIVAISFDNIIAILHEFSETLGININLIEKTFIKNLEDNALNNRLPIYLNAINGIIKSPIWGHGIASFDLKYGGYPHNVMLQLMYEGGIILAIPILAPIIYGFYKILKSQTNSLELNILFILLFSLAIPRLIFSTNVWYRESFWLLLGFTIVHMINLKIKILIKS
jgi:O-antigen ligase